MHDRTAGCCISAFASSLFLLVLVGCFGPGCANAANTASLDPTLLPKIRAATFEVVAAKPVADTLTYAKPLPLDLLPFQERNDKYFSIGTAFAIGGNRYVTAAHVLDIGIGNLWGPPALRDANGHVYSIDKIVKFSLSRDFAVFSLSDHPEAMALESDIKPELDEVVYAVGNALGTGVVVRDGLYTSNTPEEQDGRWNWIRFSAAASPGNSGGPLLDKDGKVIGVVLRKSENENLNYALPIDEVLKAPDHEAEIDNRAPYRLDIFDTVQTGTFKTQFALPLSFAEFSATFGKLESAYADTQLKALLAKEPDKLFPNGAGSSRLLHSNVARTESFPALITRESNGDWAASGKSGSKTPLSANGYVMSGSVGRNMLFHLRKPDDVTAAQLYPNPDQLMDQLLKVGFVYRPVGTEQIKVTALGKPTEDSIHTDAWQRRWQVRVWPLPFINALIVTLSLPVPDGYVTIARFAPANQEHDHLIDLEAMTDFIDVAYTGTLAQWKDYLGETALLPALFKTLKMDFEIGHRFGYASKRLSFSVPQELQPIGANSVLELGLGYFHDNGKVVWDVGDIRLRASANDRGSINIQRHVAASDDLDDAYKSTWDKILHRQHPYDAIARNENDETKITAVADAPGATAPSVLYTAFVGVSGISPQDAMKAKIDLLLKSLRIEER